MRPVLIASMKGNPLMCHKQFSKRITACVTAFMLCAFSVQAAHISLDPNNSNDTVSLASLLNGEVVGVTVGDKTFDEFFYSNLGDMPDAADVQVFGFMDEADNFGISFHGSFIDLPGDGSSDALLRFTVQVSTEEAENGFRISDAHLFAGGIGVGEDSVFVIDESFQQNNSTMSVFATTLDGQLETKLSDWTFFEENHTRLRVTKDIFALTADGSNLPARTTIIDQSFSQEFIVPEPATLGLVAMALLGIAIGKR